MPCLLLLILCLLSPATAASPAAAAAPNILLVTAEDISPNLACYGDPDARTPHLDAFAAESLRFTNCFSTHPCCSPSRSTIATGIYPTRLGTFQHRAKMWVPDEIRTFTQILRAHGWYCFNGTRGGREKTDYNFKPPADAWDKIGSKRVEWRFRPQGRPFFGQVNLFQTHQSQYGLRPPGAPSTAAPGHRHDPAELRLPPYYPDTPAIRSLWAEYHERISLMDSLFADLLGLLEQDGLAGDTIVIFVGDNGHGPPAGKIWLWDQGLHVPLIIRVPEKWRQPAPQVKPGAVDDRLISFLDFAPTILRLAGIDADPRMQGRAFLGRDPGEAREFIHAARDFHDVSDFDGARAVRDRQFHYIRNLMPHLGWDAIDYSWQRAPFALESWRREAAAGRLDPATRQSAFFRRSKPAEELFDTANDPFQLHNLAADPAHAGDLERLRAECRRWMTDNHDLGLLSQYELYTRAEADSPWQMATDPQRNPIQALVDAAELAARRDPAQIPALQQLLTHPDAAIRRWGAVGLLSLGKNATPARDSLRSHLDDPSPDVRMSCAEALCQLGETERPLATLIALLSHESGIIRNETLLALARIGPPAKAALPHLEKALTPCRHRDIWSSDNVPDTVATARACISAPDPPVTGPLPKSVPLTARRLRHLE